MVTLYGVIRLLCSTRWRLKLVSILAFATLVYWIVPDSPPSFQDFPEVSETWVTDTHAHIIHQVAPANRSTWHPAWEQCQQTWIDFFPGYEYKMWTDSDVHALIATNYAALLPLYLSYDADIKRYDIARYVILFHHGGVYADMDVQVVRPFAELVPVGRVGVAESPFVNERVQNALLTSPPRHPFWFHVLRRAYKTRRLRSVLQATGPGLLLAVMQHAPPEMFHLLERQRFAPPYADGSAFFAARVTLPPVTDARVVTVHHGTCAWCNKAHQTF
jgi:hypothetical protein